MRWEISVRPEGDGGVNIVLPATEDCDVEGAICTGGARTLSSRIKVTIRGPHEPNIPATGAPTISGTVRVGETLTADTTGIADSDGLDNATYTYQWIANEGTSDTDIQEATGATYTLVSGDEGKAIKLKVSFTDDAGNEESLTSAPTTTVAARPNTPATGAPTITGTAQVGETLTADTSGIADADGLDNPAYTYQWVRNDGTTDADIQDATGSAYTLVSGDAGKAVKVKVNFTDDAGNDETLTSAPTTTVAARPNTPATGAPAISGTARVGETLTVDTLGITDEDGLDNATYTYQWIANDGTSDTDIQDATGATYTLVSGDEGKAIKVRVSFTDDAGNEESLTSTPVDPDRPYGLTAAVSDGAVVLTWKPPVGQSYMYDYQILRNRPELGEAKPLVHVEYTETDETTYTDTDVEPGVLYVYRVKAVVDVFGRLGEASEPVEIRTAEPTPGENSPATGAPTIGGTAQVGQTLTAGTSGIADGDGLDNVSFSYRWVADDADIAGATGSSYTLTGSDEGRAIKVRVSFTDDAGNEETLTSAATRAVAPPLTAQLLDTPLSHDGQTAFTFELRFSEEFELSYVTLQGPCVQGDRE